MRKILGFAILAVIVLLPAVGWTADGEIQIPVQGAKLTGTFINSSGRIDGGNATWSVKFDDSEMQCVGYEFRLPEDYASTPVWIIQNTMEDATAGSVNYSVEFMAITPGDSADVDTASFDSANSIAGGTAVPGTTGYLQEISITVSNTDGWGDGDKVVARVCRAVGGPDSATGDSEMRNVCTLKYTLE